MTLLSTTLRRDATAFQTARRDKNAPSTLTTDRLDRKTGRSTNGLSGPPSDQSLSCHEMAFNMWDPLQSGLRRPRAPFPCASRLHPACFGPTSMRKPLSRPERDDCGTSQTSMRKPLSRPERDDCGTSQTSIYERAFVKRGRCGFCVAGLPHMPFRRRLRSIWSISDLPADEWSCNPQHIL